MNPCVAGCGRSRLPGRGRRYCAECKAEADARSRKVATERTRKWREANPEQYAQQKKDHYARTAEEQRRRSREWYYANPERVKAQRAAKKELKRPRVHRYGITPADYDRMLAEQGNACAICGRTENGKRHNFDVDHSHDTGEVRGLLCNRCNRLLSNATDDPTILQRAIDYLGGSL